MNQPPAQRITWKTGDINPGKTGEYLAAWQIGPDEYTYTVEMYYVDTGWEAKGFLAFSPDFWQEIRPPKVKQQ